MKTLVEFKERLKEITEKNLRDEQLQFVWELMKSPYVEFHYDLLKDRTLPPEFRRDLKARFDEHGEEAETFLINKLNNKEDPEFQGEIIFILGKINKKYKTEILTHTRDLAESPDDDIREKALIVLGWVGTMKDTKILQEHLLNDTRPECRAWSASSYMQMWFGKKSEELKRKAWGAYQIALNEETDRFVTATVLTAVREMGNTKLGISQMALNQLDAEKIEAAKAKAIRFLNKQLKKVS